MDSMYILAGLLDPQIGLVFWMTLSFLIVFFLLKKLAWKPILGALKEREDSIESALKSAEEAKEEMARLQASNEDLVKEARIERERLIKEAKEIRDNTIATAKDEAKAQADAIMDKARVDIEIEKKAAMAELKGQVAQFSLDIAEKILRKELENDSAQKDLVDELVKNIEMN